jgi:HSP20 family molecular chaperone IbpA
MSVFAPTRTAFRSLLRIAASSVANPLWFAAPVDSEEDQDSITVVFHVPGKRHGRVQVQGSDHGVTVWGGRQRDGQRPMRLCALPCPIIASAIETARSGDLLRVRLPKRRPATAKQETSSSST